MAFKNFIPTIWEEAIERELEKLHVFAQDTNRKYEGSVKKAGDTVRILGVGKPSIKTQVGDTDIKLDPAEKISDSAVSMKIDTISYFNYKVGDIDKAQSQPKSIMDALNKETSEGLANEVDIAISNLAKEKTARKADKTATVITTDNILNYIDTNIQTLYENNVSPSTEITLTVPPWFYTMLKQAYVKLDTDNSKMIENGKVGRYGNVLIRMSNNVAQDSDGSSLIQLKTKRAIASAQPMKHVEPYRPEGGFEDAVKGFILYGQKIVRPKEMVILNCKGGNK